MYQSIKKVFFISAVLCCSSTVVNAAVIDFEGFAMGTIIDDEYGTSPAVSAINIGGGPNLAVIYDTRPPIGEDPDLEAPFTNINNTQLGSLSPGNVLILQENFTCDEDTCSAPDDEGTRAAGTFFFEFESVINLTSIDFFDIEGDETPGNAINLFDVNGNEIMAGLFFTPDTGGDNKWDQLVFNVDGVKRIELNMGGSGAIDNIQYSVVPVPAAAWLFGTGLLGLVGVARRKK